MVWWQLQRASEVDARGEQIATDSFDSHDWIPATVPGTVLTSFVNIGAVPNPNYADDVDQISESFFRSNFWYRNEFEVTNLDGEQQWLNFDGINWKANVFLNGQRLGRIEGAFMRGKFNVTGLLRKGKNYLAVEVICNEHFGAVKEKDENTTQFNGGLLGADNPTFHATIGWLHFRSLSSISSFMCPKKLSCGALSQQFAFLDMDWKKSLSASISTNRLLV